MKRIRTTHLVLLLLCVMYFFTYLDRTNVSTAAAGFGKDFNLNKTEIGLVFSAFAYPYLLFQIIGGWVSDRFGAYKTLIACGLIWSLGTVLSGFAGGLISLLLARLVLGFGEGATFPAATSAMSRWVPKGKRGFAQGITHSSSRLGNAVAPVVVAAIMISYGWREAFIATGVVSFSWVIAWAVLSKENPKDHPHITAEELAQLPNRKRGPSAKVEWGPLFRRIAPVTIVYFCYGWTLWLFLSWVPQYFLHNYHLNLKSSAIFATSVFAAGVIGDTLGGLITDAILKRTGNLKRARSTMVSTCMFLALCSLIPLFITHDLVISVICLASGFFFSELTIGPMWAIPMDIAPEHAGTASGMMNTGSALAAILSPVVGGFIIDQFGNWDLPFFGSMVLLALGMVLAIFMHPEHRFEAVGPSPSLPAVGKPGV